MASKLAECPVCRDENWSFVRGKFVCSKEKDHSVDMLTNAVLRYSNTMMLAKQKLSFVADSVGPNAAWEMDERIVTLLFTDGVKFVIKLQEVRGDTTLTTLYVNDVIVCSKLFKSDMASESQFRILSGYSPEEFDSALAERLSGGRLTADAHR